jgi:glycosyltransferase involved in cell wall biosynthesis
MYIIPKVIKNRNRVISVSKYGRHQLVKYIGFKKEKVEVIYNSYLNEIDNILPNSQNEKIILTLGRLTYIKNPDIWLKVVNKVSKIEPNIKFVWVGADINQMVNMCKKIDELKLNQFAKIVEYINDPVSYYSKSYIYFQPSLIESHGIAVIDAMASGLPCVVSNVGGLRESIINNKTGFLVEPSNVNGFVEKIVLLLNDVELSKRLGLSGKRFAHEIFSENIQKYKFLTLYNKLV